MERGLSLNVSAIPLKKESFDDLLALLGANSNKDGSDRFMVTPPSRACNSTDGQRVVGASDPESAFEHILHHGFAHCAIEIQMLPFNLEPALFDLIVVGDHASMKDL